MNDMITNCNAKSYDEMISVYSNKAKETSYYSTTYDSSIIDLHTQKF